MTPQNYSKEDYLCLTDEEKLAHYLEQRDALEKLNEDLDISQEGLLELQKELTLKRHALEENDKLFALAKGLKDENEELKKSIPNAEKELGELEALKTRFATDEAEWHNRLQGLENEKQLIVSENSYLSELMKEYEIEIERVKQEASVWIEQKQQLLLELESLKNQELAEPPFDVKAELQKKAEENALLYSEVGKIKIIVVQGMKEAKELKNKFTTLLQTYEELTIKKKEQESLVNALQSKLHETTSIKNRLEQECKENRSDAEKHKGLLQVTQDSFEKELLLARQLLAKKVKESALLQEKLEELDSSYQDKIKHLISDYQDRIESLQVQTQKLLREKEASNQHEALSEIQGLLEPIVEKIKDKLSRQKSAGQSNQSNDSKSCASFQNASQDSSDQGSSENNSASSQSSASNQGSNSVDTSDQNTSHQSPSYTSASSQNTSYASAGSQSSQSNYQNASSQSFQSQSTGRSSHEETTSLIPDWKIHDARQSGAFTE